MLNTNIHYIIALIICMLSYFFKVTFSSSTVSTVSYKVKALGYTCAHKATW